MLIGCCFNVYTSDMKFFAVVLVAMLVMAATYMEVDAGICSSADDISKQYRPYTPLIHPVINCVVTGSLCVQIFTLFSIGLVQP